MNARITATLFLLSAPLIWASSESEIDSVEFAKDIAEFQQIRQKVGLPKHLLKPNAERIGTELDLNDYFEVFETLSIKPDVTLDWVYEFYELGGNPLIYSRSKDQEPFTTPGELVEAVKVEASLGEVEAIWNDFGVKSRKLTEKSGISDPFSGNTANEEAREKLWNELHERLAKHPRREYWNWWRESIIADESPQSYLELAALYLLANQFALRWHSLYNDLEILPSKAALKDCINRYLDERNEEIVHFIEGTTFRETYERDIAERAGKLDPAPHVEFKNDTVEVTLLTFTKWGGFLRKTLVLSKSAPHTLVSETDKIEVVWWCGIIY